MRYSQAELGWCDIEPLLRPAGTEQSPVADCGASRAAGQCNGASDGLGASIAVRLHFHKPQRAVTPGQVRIAILAPIPQNVQLLSFAGIRLHVDTVLVRAAGWVLHFQPAVLYGPLIHDNPRAAHSLRRD